MASERTRKWVYLAAAMGLAWTCADPTVDGGETRIPGGTFDLTTVLDSFSFETGGPPPQPDCPNNTTQYCTHFRAYSGATLTGTLVLVPEANPGATFERFLTVGSFGGTFCDAIDTQTLTGCTHASAVATTTYSDGSLSKNTLDAVSDFAGTVGGAGLGPNVRLIGMMSRDSLYGRVQWSQFVARSPPTHIGRFVARRRP